MHSFPVVANSAFHPFGVCKWVVIHVITWIMGVETIMRQPRVAYGWLVVSQSVGAGLATTYRLYAHCLWHEQRRCSCGMRLVALYKC